MALSFLTKNLNMTVKESIKEDGVWIFSDSERKADKKVCYTQTSLFQEFQDKEFVVLLQNDDNTELSKEIYKNIIKSGLHRATVKTPVLSCPVFEEIENDFERVKAEVQVKKEFSVEDMQELL